MAERIDGQDDDTPAAVLNPLPRMLLRHAMVGFGASAVFVAAMWLWGPKPLRDLLTIGPALLLWWGCGLTFGSIQMGAAIMSIGRPEDPPATGRRRRLIPAVLAVRAVRTASRR